MRMCRWQVVCSRKYCHCRRFIFIFSCIPDEEKCRMFAWISVFGMAKGAHSFQWVSIPINGNVPNTTYAPAHLNIHSECARKNPQFIHQNYIIITIPNPHSENRRHAHTHTIHIVLWCHDFASPFHCTYEPNPALNDALHTLHNFMLICVPYRMEQCSEIRHCWNMVKCVCILIIFIFMYTNLRLLLRVLCSWWESGNSSTHNNNI